VRRIGTDPKLAEAVATEAIGQMARRRQEIDQESETQRRSLRQLNQNLAADNSVDSGARFERMAGLQHDIEAAERRLAELAVERADLNAEGINGDDLRRTRCTTTGSSAFTIGAVTSAGTSTARKRTGALVSLAICSALDFGYTNSAPQLMPG
jgi:hypothetical protein